MPEIKPDQPLLPSVLDRQLDDNPDVRREPPRSQHQILRELKLSVRRDLENLLNARIRCRPWPAELKELKQSLVNYGSSDLTGASLGTPREREEFRRTIQNVISLYERRLRRL